MSTREEDFVKEIHLATTHNKLLIFSSFGKVYSLKAHDIPEASLKARGKPIVNLLPFNDGEKIATFLVLPSLESQWSDLFIIFATPKCSGVLTLFKKIRAPLLWDKDFSSLSVKL